MVFFDVDTQIDFLLPVAALYVPGAEKIIPALAKLTEYARQKGIKIISSADAHAPQDPEFGKWPPHCVAGTLGQRKAPETLLAGAATVPNQAGPLPAGWQTAPQIIVEKQTLDVFQTATIRHILDELRPERFVVYGVVTEYCVKYAAEGLLEHARKSGAKILVVTDAIKELDAKCGAQTLDALRAAGAQVVTAEAVLR